MQTESSSEEGKSLLDDSRVEGRKGASAALTRGDFWSSSSREVGLRQQKITVHCGVCVNQCDLFLELLHPSFLPSRQPASYSAASGSEPSRTWLRFGSLIDSRLQCSASNIGTQPINRHASSRRITFARKKRLRKRGLLESRILTTCRTEGQSRKSNSHSSTAGLPAPDTGQAVCSGPENT